MATIYVKFVPSTGCTCFVHENHPQKVKLQKFSVLPKSDRSANTVENSLRFFNVSYILATHHKTSQTLFNLYFSPCSIMVTMTKHPPPKQSLRDFPSKSIEDSLEISQCTLLVLIDFCPV